MKKQTNQNEIPAAGTKPRRAGQLRGGLLAALFIQLGVAGGSGQSVQFGGLSNQPVGGAVLNVVSNRLVISNTGTQGVFGAAIHVGQAAFGSVTLDAIPSSLMPTGDLVAVSAIGEARGQSGRTLGALRAVNAGDAIEYSADFSGLGAVAVTALLYDEETLVAAAHNLTGTVARVTGGFRAQRWIPYLPRGDRPGAQIEFLASDEPPGQITLVQPIPSWGTRLVVVPQATSLEFPSIPWVEPPVFDPWEFIPELWRRPPFKWPRPPWPDPGPDPWPLGPVSRLEVLGERLGQITLLKERVGMFGLAHEAIGEARLSALDGTLRLADIPPTGDHGVNLTYVPSPIGLDRTCGDGDPWPCNPPPPPLPPQPPPPPPPCGEFATHNYPLRWRPVDQAGHLPEGAFLISGLRGFVGAGPDQFLGSLIALGAGTNVVSNPLNGTNNILIQADFSGLASPRQQVQVFSNGIVVATGSITNDVIAWLTNWPGGGGFNVPPLCPPPYIACPPPEVSFRWPASVALGLADNRVVFGDELRVIPELPPTTNAVHWTALGLRVGGGLPSLTIEGVDHGPAGTFFQGLPHLPLGGAIVQEVSGELHVANLATNDGAGVQIALGQAGFGVVDIENPLDGPAVPDGANVRVEAFGALNGAPHQPLATVTATRVGPAIQFTASYPLVAATGTTVVVFDGPVIVGLDPAVPTPIVTVPTNIARYLRLDPIWQMGPDSVWSLIDLPGRPPISISGRPPVRGDRVAFIRSLSDPYPQPNLPLGGTNQGNPSPQPYRRDFGSVSRLEITGRHIGSFRVLRSQIGMFHQVHEAIGQARLLGLGGELRVNNLLSDASNPDGVRLPITGFANGIFAAHWRPLDPFSNAPPGALLRLDARGFNLSGQEQDIGTLDVTSLNGALQITADLGAVGATSRVVEVLRSNVVLFTATVPGPAGAVAQAAGWPDAGVLSMCPYPLGPPTCPGGVRGWRWTRDTVLEIQGQSFIADELRVLGTSATSVTALASMSLRAARLPGLHLLTAGEIPTSPPTLRIQHIDGLVAVSWKPMVPRQRLEAADRLEDVPLPIPHIASPLHLTPAAGAGKFYRIHQSWPVSP